MNWHHLIFAILVACHVLHGQTPIGDSASMAALDNQRIIQAGDWLSIKVGPIIQVGKDHCLTWVNRVGNSGAIPVPLLKEYCFNAVGETCQRFAYTIKRELEKNYFTQSTVIVKFTDKPKPGSMGALDNHRRLKSGDTVSIRIKEDRREALEQVIAVTDEIQVPYIGLMKAGGLTCQELAFQCKAELEKNFFKTSTVLIAKTAITTNSVSSDCHWPDFVVAYGSFAKPGKYDLPYDHDLTVMGLLQRAGGHNSKSAAPEIQIVRKTPKGNKRILINAQAILNEKHSHYDLFLRDGDVVIIK